jgi:hypothetical protein
MTTSTETTSTETTSTTIKVGDLVLFGRPNGQKTQGRVVRVNPVSITVEQTEERGVVKVREAGTKWRLHPSLVQLVGDEKPLVAATGGKVKPPIAFKKKTTAAPAPAPAGAGAPRPEAEILSDIRGVETFLSPECLAADGERTRAQVKAASRRLNARRAELIAELGREPSFQEVWGAGTEFGTSGGTPVSSESTETAETPVSSETTESSDD